MSTENTENIALTATEFFAWMRAERTDKRLTQDMVDGANDLLAHTSADALKSILVKLNGAGSKTVAPVQSTKPVALTRADIYKYAREMQVEPATLKAVIDVEARSSGFYDDGLPKILFERHVMWRELGKVDYFTKREQLNAVFPDVCSESTGAYNSRLQYEKLAVAAALHWDAAHASCSWGLGQVMGNNWKDLGYASVRAFVDAMHESEAAQLDGMCRFIKVNGLVDELQRHDWAGFARRYNGSNYAKNEYDTKLAKAYAKAKQEGW